jgi:hypothetical protein
MADIVTSYKPNSSALNCAVGSTSWRVISSDGNAYASISALLAAGKTPFASQDAGNFSEVSVRSIATGGTSDGSAFEVEINKASAPTNGAFCSGSGQTIVNPDGPVWNLWAKMSVSTDILNIRMRW